ncbi:MAG: hypothetical protein IPM56_00615 [Ignavibacteriales bacterium]|nr:MAG: hypothetical protein IPM56_00615 [Ignavibacteriales bacterium]
MNRKFFHSIICLVIVLTSLSDLNAIPAFARKYNMTCKTCHAPFPKLKEYGEEFAGNGFVLKDQDAPRYYVETGDAELSLIRDIPIAMRLEGYLTYNNSYTEQTDFSAPYILKLLSGGTITKDVAYYFYFFFSERGEVAGLEDAFLMFNDLFGSDLDLYVGQFQVSDPLFKRELRLTFEDYQIYKTKVGLSSIDLTYDRGVMLTYGFDSGTDITLEVVNGAGIGAANSFRNFDNDKYKNILGRISQSITKAVRVGGVGYLGKENQSGFNNEAIIFGGDATLSFEPIELNVQYIERKDDNPLFNQVKQEIKTRGAFGELLFMPNGDESKWYAAGLFNWTESDIESLNYKSAALNIGYMIKRNIRLAGEFSYNIKDKFGKAGIGIIAAF